MRDRTARARRAGTPDRRRACRRRPGAPARPRARRFRRRARRACARARRLRAARCPARAAAPRSSTRAALPERPPEGFDPTDRGRAERLAVKGVLERHEAAASGPAVLRPVLERQLERDLDGGRAIVAVEDVLESRRRDAAQRLGELARPARARCRRAPCGRANPPGGAARRAGADARDPASKTTTRRCHRDSCDRPRRRGASPGRARSRAGRAPRDSGSSRCRDATPDACRARRRASVPIPPSKGYSTSSASSRSASI